MPILSFGGGLYLGAGGRKNKFGSISKKLVNILGVVIRLAAAVSLRPTQNDGEVFSRLDYDL